MRQYPGGSSSNTELTTLKEIPIPAVVTGDFIGQPHQIIIEAKGSEITTWIDGHLVDTMTDGSQSSGTIGIQAPRPHTALIHQVLVEVEGKPVFHTDFANNMNPFTAGRPTGRDSTSTVASPGAVPTKT